MAILRTAGVSSGSVRAMGTARSAAPRSIRMIVRAEGESQTKTLDLTMNEQSVSGYVEKDTAGQSNMYPVLTKPFEAGSSSDTSNNTVNSLAAAGAAAAALGAIAIGLTAVTSSPPAATIMPAGEYRTLTQYKEIFTAEN